MDEKYLVDINFACVFTYLTNASRLWEYEHPRHMSNCAGSPLFCADCLLYSTGTRAQIRQLSFLNEALIVETNTTKVLIRKPMIAWDFLMHYCGVCARTSTRQTQSTSHRDARTRELL